MAGIQINVWKHLSIYYPSKKGVEKITYFIPFFEIDEMLMWIFLTFQFNTQTLC